MHRDPIVSNDQRLQIIFLDSREPNNGRMLWEVEVRLDSKPINNLLFKDKWNYINFQTESLQISDGGNQFYYIPVEESAKLICSSNGEVKQLKYQPTSTSKFKGNKFSDSQLMEIFDDEITLTNLGSFKVSSYLPENNEFIFEAEFLNEDEILVHTYSIQDRKRIDRSKKIEIKNFANPY